MSKFKKGDIVRVKKLIDELSDYYNLIGVVIRITHKPYKYSVDFGDDDDLSFDGHELELEQSIQNQAIIKKLLGIKDEK